MFLVRPDAVANAGANGFKPIHTNHGNWIPAAKWERGEFELMAPDAKMLIPVLETILEDYLKQPMKGKRKTPRKRYFYLEQDGKPCYALSASHPNGLAILVFSGRKKAEVELAEKSGTAETMRIRQTDDLNGFFIHAADDGYAGAILDGEEPVYFCLDGAENMMFLKLQLSEEEEVEECLLAEDGRWERYEGEVEFEFYLDQDSCDKNMVENLGNIPFLGHRELDRVWTIQEGQREEKTYILSAKEGPWEGIPGGNAILLFHQKRHAMEFLLDRGMVDFQAVSVANLKTFLRTARRRQLSVLLEPFGHRAISGTLWLNKEDIILDSFSGFWTVQEGWEFARID
jgi:hypothetical protein